MDQDVGALRQRAQGFEVAEIAPDDLCGQVGVSAGEGADAPAFGLKRADKGAAEEAGGAGDGGQAAQTVSSARNAPAR